MEKFTYMDGEKWPHSTMLGLTLFLEIHHPLSRQVDKDEYTHLPKFPSIEKNHM